MRRLAALVTVALVSLVGGVAGIVWADGSETLGPPSISIGSGSGTVAAGTGLYTEPGTIDINVPGAVVQALLYWGDRFDTKGVANPAGDDTITVNGISVTGVEIGFSPPIPGNAAGPGGTGQIAGIAYRADITGLGLVTSGANSLSIADFDTDGSGDDDGAALIVIYDDGSTAEIGVRDGSDVAYQKAPVPAAVVTVPQTFAFAAEPAARQATLTLLVSDTQWTATRQRTSEVKVLVDGVPATTDLGVSPLVNILRDDDGPQWDTQLIIVDVPAGATSLTVEVVSTGNDPASLHWIAAALAIAVTDEPPGNQGCTPGFWKNHTDLWHTYTSGQTVDSVFTVPGSLSTLADDSLLDALKYGGGPGTTGMARNLLRAAVAALLNAEDPDVAYPMSTADIIAQVNAALASENRGTMETLKNTLDANNNLGCSIDAHGNPI
jgi:hypothetical protein